MLLIHGGLGSADVWGFQIPALADKHKVIVADSRGHGRSTRSDQPYSYALMADDYVALLDHLEIDKTALVGWSDGAIIGLDIAMRHPERLSRLFAFGANYTVEGWSASADDPVFNAAIARTGKATTPACHPPPASSTPSRRRSPRCGRPSRTTPRTSCARSPCRH